MFCKLALRNVRRSFRDYGVYLLTLTFGVCLFYTFNSLDGQGAIQYLAQSGSPMVEVILSCISVFSVFVAVVLACLMVYANRFLLRRRKRELGTYLLLGLGQGQVSLILMLETGLVALVSMVLGLGLGVLASMGLSRLTTSMFQISVDHLLGLRFSPAAAGKTVLYFGLIFLVMMVLSGVQVSRAKLLDLMQGNRRNEPLKQAGPVPAGGLWSAAPVRHGCGHYHAACLCAHAGSGYRGNAADFPVPVRLCAAAGPGPARVLL